MQLTDIPALSHLTHAQLENIHAAAEEIDLAVGEELMRHGEAGGKLYFLLEGRVQVYVEKDGKEITLNEVGAPAILGELELLLGHPRTASLRALIPCQLLALSSAAVQERIDEGDPAVLQVMYGISRVIASRLVAITAKLVDLEAQADPVVSRELRTFREKLFSDWTV